MAENLGSTGSSLLCTEDIDAVCNTPYDSRFSLPWHRQENQNVTQEPLFYNNRSNSLMGFAIQSEEIIQEMVEREREHMPRVDYLERMRSGNLDPRVRREALEWICKVQAHFGFGPLTVCFAMNYLDRFLSAYKLLGGVWIEQMVALVCLSLGAKMAETGRRRLVDLQVANPKAEFSADDIHKMELVVLEKLKWKMQALTPCSFIDYFLSKINGDPQLSRNSISRSVQLILNTIRSIEFLKFRPSEIAAAVAISVSRETQAIDIDKARACFVHVEEASVLNCIDLLKELSLIGGSTAPNVASSSSSFVPQSSPNGVLDAARSNYRSR